MIWTLLGAHALVIGVVLAAGHRLGVRVFALAAVPPAVAALWSASQVGGGATRAEVGWVAGLDLEFAFVVDPLRALLGLVVAGIGALVLVYARGYFGPAAGPADTTRFTATLLGFALAMLALVWADSVWTMFVAWEATSLLSFLLVGHKRSSAAAAVAARRALVVTGAGGLVLLAGFLVLAEGDGTTRISELVPISGARADVAAVLLLVAAATKSAQVPFHIWLPGAMSAPTPVSAYLHSATMVKAGVVLVAVAGPALASSALWQPIGLAFGLTSMVWGAVGALRHHDAKLILAWGTISQLGTMIALLTLGTAKATFAAVAIVVAHAVFKAALFMVVGEIDVRAGTRDIRALGGIGRSMPLAATVAIVSGLSMAGAPTLLGFPAKEAAFEAVLGASGRAGTVAAVAVIGGSVLTVAYTIRLLIGLLGPGARPTPVAAARPAMAGPAAVLAGVSVVGFVALDAVSERVRVGAAVLDTKADVYSLLRWPGLTPAFAWSVAVLAVGALAGVALARRTADAPGTIGADAVDATVDAVPRLARAVTARLQHGSLPVYVTTMGATATLASIPFLTAIDLDAMRAWDNVAQPALGFAAVAAAAGAAVVGSRLGAALGLGAVGIAVSGLFVVHGAPDLVLTQLLVETVIVVGFVIGLGHLGRRFPRVGPRWRFARVLVGVGVGTAVTAGLLTAGSRPVGSPPLDDLTKAAVEGGGGNNVVNVILTDIRALDTLGEVLVLVVVAVGVLALRAAGRHAQEVS